MFKKYVDISQKITDGMQVWPGDPEVNIVPFAAISSDGYSLHEIKLGTHSGTHVDYPGHLLEGKSLIPGLEAMIGHCTVYSKEAAAELAGQSEPTVERLIVKGGVPDIESLKTLVRKGLKLIGVEAPSIDSGDRLDAHLLLLESGVVIIEGLALQNASEGPAFLIALPLSIDAPDGAPARVILAY